MWNQVTEETAQVTAQANGLSVKGTQNFECSSLRSLPTGYMDDLGAFCLLREGPTAETHVAVVTTVTMTVASLFPYC